MQVQRKHRVREMTVDEKEVIGTVSEGLNVVGWLVSEEGFADGA